MTKPVAKRKPKPRPKPKPKAKIPARTQEAPKFGTPEWRAKYAPKQKTKARKK